MRRALIAVVVSLLVSSCVAFVPVVDVNSVPKEKMQEAYKVRTFTVDNGIDHAKVAEYLGEITAYSCKLLPTDPPASKGNALLQLRLAALEKGANAVIDVTFDVRGTDAFGTNCWESVQASGMAVKLNQ